MVNNKYPIFDRDHLMFFRGHLIFDCESLAVQDNLKDFDISYNFYFVVGNIFALAVQGFLLLFALN
jgi:hypothetical protein